MDQGSNKDNHKKEDKFADVDELPKTEAFQDEFTREFLVSPEEVEEGYYLFESKTGGYRMLFPVNALVGGGGFYSKSSDNTLETVHISGGYEEENIKYFIKIDYEKGNYTNRIKDNVEFLADLFDYEGEFDEYHINGNTIYFAEFIEDISDVVEGDFYYVFLAYVKSQNTDQAISISYGTTCSDRSKKCDINRDIERERAKKIFESFEFVD